MSSVREKYDYQSDTDDARTTLQQLSVVDTNIEFTCVDDGSGRHVYYISKDGKIRTRIRPEGFVDELLGCGERRYYFKGKCIRCRKDCIPVVLSRKQQSEAFSFNLCENCLLATTPRIRSLRGNGDAVWASNDLMPKSFFADLQALSFSEARDAELLKRSRAARYAALLQAKTRRDFDRRGIVRLKAYEYQVFNGSLVSWGFDNDKFDEYYGDLNEKKLPHGHGVKFYSDGSVYVGGWKDGLQHTENKGQYTSAIGSQYEGTWMQGMKHGKGTQQYPSGVVYIGEFAKGLEHGSGRKIFTDGTIFEGRFRFGRRDGPGSLLRNGVVIERGIYRDTEVFKDKVPPVITEMSEDGEAISASAEAVDYRNAESLLTIAFSAVARYLETHPHIITPSAVSRRLPPHLKHRLSVQYLRHMRIPGTEQFLQFIVKNDTAFNFPSEVVCSTVAMLPQDVEALACFQGANTALTALRITSNRLSAPAVEVVGKKLATSQSWLSLRLIDLSFNRMDLNAIKFICDGSLAMNSITTLRLSSCGIKANGARIIASMLAVDTHLKELDLSFNSIGAAGAKTLAEVLPQNSTLSSLNLRQNNLGVVGGEALVSCLNERGQMALRTICLADNKIGVDNFYAISSRLPTTTGNIVRSTCADELKLPERYNLYRDPAKKMA